MPLLSSASQVKGNHSILLMKYNDVFYRTRTNNYNILIKSWVNTQDKKYYIINNFPDISKNVMMKIKIK